MKKIEIAPSLLSANFLDLKSELQLCQDAKIKWLHYDVMDYDLVPNLTFRAKILKDITQQDFFKIDIHFMVKVKTPIFEDFFTEYLQAQPSMMTMHLEAMNDSETKRFIQMCHKHGVLASLAIKPKTPLEALEAYLPIIDNVLVMTVEPGFGGQGFISEAAYKISKLKKMAQDKNYHYTVEVDGGINNETISIVKKEGVDLAVAGSYLFGHEDFVERVRGLEND